MGLTGRPVRILVVLSIALLILLTSFISIFGCQQQPSNGSDISNGTPELDSTPEIDTRDITLEEASAIIGVPIPTPNYLPEDYQIREVNVENNTVILLISNEEIDGEVDNHPSNKNNVIEISIAWFSGGIPGGLKLPGKGVTVSGTRGLLLDEDDYHTIWWQPRPDPETPAVSRLHRFSCLW
jgi:hypothetical protein